MVHHCVHLLNTWCGNHWRKLHFISASSLRVGDTLTSSGEQERTVQSIHIVKGCGIFAPFTFCGSIVVNDVVASCFVAVDAKTYLLGVSHHWMAHAFEFPHRLDCNYMGQCLYETYTEEGIPAWVAAPLQWSQWMLMQHVAVHKLPHGCNCNVFRTGRC